MAISRGSSLVVKGASGGGEASLLTWSCWFVGVWLVLFFGPHFVSRLRFLSK